MDIQGNDFLSNGSTFGVESASIISDETASLIFGSATAVDPKQVTAIEEEKPDKAKPEGDEIPKIELTGDDILNDIDENQDGEKGKEKPAPVDPKEEHITEQVAAEASTFTTLTKNLIDLGVFRPRDDMENPQTAEDFRDRWFLEKDEQKNEDIYNFLIAKHGEDGVKAFQDIFVKGVSPKDYMETYARIQTFEDLDLTQEDNQKLVFREGYRRQGWTDDKIEKKLQRAIDYGDLEEEAAGFYDVILSQDKDELEEKTAQAAEREQAKIQEQQLYANNLNKIISDKLKSKEFDGIPVTEKTARETYGYMVAKKWKLPNGDLLTDFDKDIIDLNLPENHELKFKLALLLRSKLDLSKVKTSALSKTTNNLFGDLAIKDKNVKRNTPIAPKNSFGQGL